MVAVIAIKPTGKKDESVLISYLTKKYQKNRPSLREK